MGDAAPVGQRQCSENSSRVQAVEAKRAAAGRGHTQWVERIPGGLGRVPQCPYRSRVSNPEFRRDIQSEREHGDYVSGEREK